LVPARFSRDDNGVDALAADPIMKPPHVDWRCSALDRLAPVELHRIHAARQAVFVVEQRCIFQDADDADEGALHLAGWDGDGRLLAYARLVGPGIKYREPSIGRVLTTQAARGTGLGRELVRRAVAALCEAHPAAAVRISAQQRLAAFYAEQGFVAIGAPYLEDGMPHIEMLLPR
jgi:ElaA protein